jgi:hypothetical protein
MPGLHDLHGFLAQGAVHLVLAADLGVEQPFDGGDALRPAEVGRGFVIRLSFLDLLVDVGRGQIDLVIIFGGVADFDVFYLLAVGIVLVGAVLRRGAEGDEDRR